jgi:hypothetical protein
MPERVAAVGFRAPGLSVMLALVASVVAAAPPGPLFFDDFQYRDIQALEAAGWQRRSEAGHPGVPGATWQPDGVSLIDDPQHPGNRLLRLAARTDGTPKGTVQAQVCHQRKLLRGTYAARVHFSDAPLSGSGGDPVIQTFYAVAPLRFDFDPEFSELDWEYLANGGWGSDAQRLYSIAWQTVRIEPWLAYNAPTETFGSFAGWHVLLMQVNAQRSRWFVDGREVAQHGGRNHPVAKMALSFNLWFSPTGLKPASAAPREWEQDIDWVLHLPDRELAPAEVEALVRELRAARRYAVDTVPAASPPLASECRF